MLLLFLPLSITGTQVGLGLAAAGALWGAAATRKLPRTPLDLPLLLLLAITLVSALASEAPGAALRRFTGAWITLAFYLTVGWVNTPARLERALRLLLASATLIAGYGIFQHFTGLNLFGSGSSELHAMLIGGRTVYFPRGGFSHYQTYANVFFTIFCLSLALTIAGSGRARAVRLAVTVLLGFAVVLTFTRGIWLSLLAALGIFAWAFARRAALSILAGSAVLLIGVLFIPSSLGTRARSIADSETNVERLLLWETAWNMIRDRPVLGFGIGNFPRAQDAYVRDEIPQEMTRTHAHNIWLQAALDRGVPGMLAFLWLSLVLLHEALRTARATSRAGGLPHALAVGALAALAGFYIDGLVQNNFGDSQATLLYWIAAGVVVVCGRAAASVAPAVSEAGA